jgi:predicted RNA methylase
METASRKTIEERRLEEQVRLDSLKTAAERNKWGQFATPPDLALSIARYAHGLIGDSQVRFLDPAIGTGSFFSALCQVLPPEQIATAAGTELDPIFAETATALWRDLGLTVMRGDFTRQLPPDHKFNLVLTNPPYVRHHHLSAADKHDLRARLAQSLHLEISGLAGLYCYFLLLCHDWMEDGGVAAWLIPSEFMDVNYGATIRRYLTEQVTLLRIHRFCPTDVQFADALVSSAVVVFRKSTPPTDHAVCFSFAGSIEHPKSESPVPLALLRHSRKWTQFPAHAAVESAGELTLGDIFSIKRGLATGANEYFILTEADIETWQIPSPFLKPIFPGPRYLTEDIVGAMPGGAPRVSPQLFLIDCSEPEEKIQVTWPRFYEYLQRGKKQNIHTSYLASRRAPWYSQEQRPPAPFLFTYMGRSRSGKHPFRFIWNQSQATAHNVYLFLYPKGRLRSALRKCPGLEQRVFEGLQRIAPEQLLSEGRVYGGGLHKVEPKELARIPARTVLDAIESEVRFERQVTLFA